MHPNTPTGRSGRVLDRLNAVCRELNAPLAGALPALVLVGVFLFGNPAVQHGAPSEARPGGCDHSRSAAPQLGGPRSQDLLCMGVSLQRVAETGGEGGR